MTLDDPRPAARALRDGRQVPASRRPLLTDTRERAADTARRLDDAASSDHERQRWPSQHPLVQRLLAAVQRDDLRQAEALVRVVLSEGCPLTALCDDVLRPLLAQLEADGSAPSRVRRARVLLSALVSRLRAGAVRRPHLGTVAFACPQGTAFLDTYMVAAVMESHGWETVHLGAVCLQDLDELAADRPWPCAVVVAVDDMPVSEVRTYCRQVHARLPGTVVVAHGRPESVTRVAQLTGVDACSSSVSEAAQRIARLATPLSDRELAILAHVSRGLTNKEVATVLSVAPSTVKSHLDRIFDKLGCPDRAAAVAQSVRAGWIA